MEVMVTFALKTIHAIRFCYGYCPEGPREKDFALSTLLTAAAGNMKEKEKAIADVQSLEEYRLGEVVEQGMETSTTNWLKKPLGRSRPRLPRTYWQRVCWN
jgi:hypothetical protein